MSDAVSPSGRGAEGYPSTLVHEESTNEADAELLEIQRNRTEEYIGLMEALNTDTQRKILYGLVDGLGEASYRDLEHITTVSKRSLRKHTQRLESKGIVERRDANYGIVSFPDHKIRALAQHVLYCYEDQLD